MANDSLSKLKQIQAEARALLEEKANAAEEAKLHPFKKFVHFWVLVGKSFVRNRCPVRASALAYATLLALIPMLAVVVSVSSSLLKKEGEKPIEQIIDKLVDYVAPQLNQMTNAPGPAPDGGAARPDTDAAKAAAARKEVVTRINEFIGNIRSGTLGVTGMVALIFVAIAMLARIEGTFNDIWGVTRGRTWFARVVQYWAAITLGPLILIVALGLTSGPHLKATQEWIAELPVVGEMLVKFLFRLAPFIILSLAFGLFYQLMPNTKVHWRAALVGGIVGGCLWELNNLFSVLYVSRVVTNSKIYGSLGMIPVFMIGLYFSWLILLFGAQVAYAWQNRAAYAQEKQAENVNQRGREFIALRLMTLVGQRFQQGEKPPTALEIAQVLGVPSRLVGQVLQPLVQGKLLLEGSETETGYAPARPLEKITCEDMLQAMRAGLGQELSTQDDATRARVREQFERIRQAERQLAQAVTLKTLAADEVEGRAAKVES